MEQGKMASNWQKEEDKKYFEETQRDLSSLCKYLDARDTHKIHKYGPYVRKWLQTLARRLTPAPGSLPDIVREHVVTLVYDDKKAVKHATLVLVLMSSAKARQDMAPLVVDAGLCILRVWECPFEDQERRRFHKKIILPMLGTVVEAMHYLCTSATGDLPSAQAMDGAMDGLCLILEYALKADAKDPHLLKAIGSLREKIWRVALIPPLLKGEFAWEGHITGRMNRIERAHVPCL
jgi:hypothetical protein